MARTPQEIAQLKADLQEALDTAASRAQELQLQRDNMKVALQMLNDNRK